MNILGINAYHADASAALLKDGMIAAAAEEERFNRIKHSAGFPEQAIRYCLREGGLSIADVDHIAVSSKPVDHIEDEILFILSGRPTYSKKIQDRLQNVAKHRDIPAAIRSAIDIDASEIHAEIFNVEHHVAHMASAYLASGFSEAAILSVDGFGDFASTMLGVGEASSIKVLEKVLFPHSLGMFYTMVTQYLGFGNYGDEGKVMGLASFGKPIYFDKMREIVRPSMKNFFELDLSYFTHHIHGVDMSWDDAVPKLEPIYSEKMIAEFGPPREEGLRVNRTHEDIAASMQKVLEESLISILNFLAFRTKCPNLAMAGGVALNCSANGKILARTPFNKVFIQPAASDAGTALGAALYVYCSLLGNDRTWAMENAYLGPAYGAEEIETALTAEGFSYTKPEKITDVCAELLSAGKIIGWFQGRMEFGPRALGNRSILADPRQKRTRELMNSRIKNRETFRPFAASVLEDYQAEYFYIEEPSPFMLFAHRVREGVRDRIPAVCHADDTIRLQSVSRRNNPRYWELIESFREKTGIPLILNTSFNENEPIVCTPADAIRCFRETRMDALAIGDFLVEK